MFVFVLLASWGASSSAPATLELIDQSGGAACLDGSQPGFWLQRGDATRLYVHMEGSWCATLEDCEHRAHVVPQTLPSSVDLGALATPWGGWYFSSDPALNPPMASWTKVLVQACDGTSWSGSNATTTRTGDGVDLHFRGAQNLGGLIAALQARHALNGASEIVVGGGAAGSPATARHVERFREALARSGSGAAVRALGAAAAAVPSTKRPQGRADGPSEWLFTQSNASASVARECLDAHSPDEKWTCLLSLYDEPLACASGTYRNRTRCAPCPPGHFCPARTLDGASGRWVATTVPHPCPAGTHRATDGAVDVAGCTPCAGSNGGVLCAAGSVTPRACPAGSLCPRVDAPPRPCDAGSFCPAGSSRAQPCPPGRVCPAGAAVPSICPLGSFCAGASAAPTLCPAGTRGVVGSGSLRVDADSACAPCPAGTLGSDPTRRECARCPAGAHCAEGDAVATMCPAGHFCPEGSVAASACPVGTRTKLRGATRERDCTPCAAGSFQDAQGQSRCRACPATASSAAGAATCACRGAGRAFIHARGICPCAAGYEASVAASSTLDGLSDCAPVARGARCPPGQVRYHATMRCVNETDCSAMNCGMGGSGTFHPDIGACDCDGARHVDEICDAECRSSLPRLVRVAGGAPRVACSEAEEPADAQRVLPVTMSAAGAFVASYELRPALLASFALTPCPVNPAMVEARRRRLALAANVFDSSIANPLLCIKTGESLLFTLSGSGTSLKLPQYISKSSLTVGAFDAANFAAEGNIAAAGGATTFTYVFKTTGVFAFGNENTASASTDALVVTVIPSHEVCPANGARIVPFSSSSASVAGVSTSGDIISEPPWWLILTILALLVAAALLCVVSVGIVRFCQRRRLTAKASAKRFANPRAMNFEVQRPGEEDLSKVVGDLKKHDDHVRHALEKQQRTNDEIASTMSSEMETLRELLASLLFVRKTPFEKIDALRTWVENALMQHTMFRAASSLQSKDVERTMRSQRAALGFQNQSAKELAGASIGNIVAQTMQSIEEGAPSMASPGGSGGRRIVQQLGEKADEVNSLGTMLSSIEDAVAGRADVDDEGALQFDSVVALQALAQLKKAMGVEDRDGTVGTTALEVGREVAAGYDTELAAQRAAGERDATAIDTAARSKTADALKGHVLLVEQAITSLQASIDGENGRIRQWSAVQDAALKAKLLEGSKERLALASALKKLHKEVAALEQSRQDQLRQFAPYTKASRGAIRTIDKQRKLLLEELQRATELHNPAYKDDAILRVKEGMAAPLTKLAMMLELQVSLARKWERDFAKRMPRIVKLEEAVRSAMEAVYNEAILERQVQDEDERRLRAQKEGTDIEAELAAVGLSDRERREQEEHEQVLEAAVAANVAQLDDEGKDDIAELKRQCEAEGLSDEDTAATIADFKADQNKRKQVGEEQATLAREKLNVRLANMKRKQRAKELREIELAKKEAELLAKQREEEETLAAKQRDAAQLQAEEIERAARTAAELAKAQNEGEGGFKSKLDDMNASIDAALQQQSEAAQSDAAKARTSVRQRMALRRQQLQAEHAKKRASDAAALVSIAEVDEVELSDMDASIDAALQQELDDAQGDAAARASVKKRMLARRKKQQESHAHDKELDALTASTLDRAHEEELRVSEEKITVELALEEAKAVAEVLGRDDLVDAAAQQLDQFREQEAQANKQAAYALQRRRARLSEIHERHAKEKADLRAKHSEEAAPVQAELAEIHESGGGSGGAADDDVLTDTLLAAQRAAEVEVLAQNAEMKARQEEAARAEAEARRQKEAAAAAEAKIAEEQRRTEEKLANQAKAEVEAKLALKKQQLEAQSVDIASMTEMLSQARKSIKIDIEKTSGRENAKLRERLQHRKDMARRKREQAEVAAKAALGRKKAEEAKTRAAAAQIVIAQSMASGGGAGGTSGDQAAAAERIIAKLADMNEHASETALIREEMEQKTRITNQLTRENIKKKSAAKAALRKKLRDQGVQGIEFDASMVKEDDRWKQQLSEELGKAMLEVDQEFRQRGLEMRDDGAQAKLEQLKQFVPEDEMARIMSKQAEESEKAHAELEEFKKRAEAEKREKLHQIAEQREAFEKRLERERNNEERQLETEMEEKMAQMRAEMEAKKSAKLTALLSAQKVEEERHSEELRKRKEEFAAENVEKRKEALRDQAERDAAKHAKLVESYVDQRTSVMETMSSELEESHDTLQRKLANRKKRFEARRSSAAALHLKEMSSLQMDVSKLDSKLSVLGTISENEGTEASMMRREASMTPTSASSSGGGAKFTDDGLSAADRKQRRLSSIAESQRRSSAGGAAGSARRSTSVAIGGGGGLLDVEPLLKQLSGVESSLRRAASVKQRAFQDPRDALLVGTQLAPGMRPRVVNQIDLEQDESDLLDFAYQILAQMEVSSGIEFKVASALPAPVSTVGAGRDAEELAGNAFRNSFFWDARDKILYLHRDRLSAARPGEYITLLLHCLAHIRDNEHDLSDDMQPSFVRMFHNCVGILGQMHYRQYTVHHAALDDGVQADIQRRNERRSAALGVK